jgi:hypothetical protein
LGFALRDADFKAAIMQQAAREQILEALKRTEIAMGFGKSQQAAGAGAGPGVGSGKTAD